MRGTNREIEQIRTMLEQMGETDVASDRVADNRSNVRIIPLTGRNARSVLGQLEHVWPTMRKNKVNVITPSSVQPPTGEGASLEALFPGDGIVERRHSAATALPPIGDASMRPESAANVGENEPPVAPPAQSAAAQRKERRTNFVARSIQARAQPRGEPAGRLDRRTGHAGRPDGGIDRIPFVFVNQAAQPEPKSDEKRPATQAAAADQTGETRRGQAGRMLSSRH